MIPKTYKLAWNSVAERFIYSREALASKMTKQRTNQKEVPVPVRLCVLGSRYRVEISISVSCHVRCLQKFGGRRQWLRCHQWVSHDGRVKRQTQLTA